MVQLYNTLTRKIEEFKPLNSPVVTMYTCGPTVYDYQHIGHMRRYVGDDILIRVLQFNGFDVRQVMNVTDVGHLVSDADVGEDKMEKGARKFNKSVWEIAKMFEKQFKDSCRALNIRLPKNLLHATDYIKEQIALINVLEEKGYTYKIADGIYFDTGKVQDYFKLSRQNPQELKAGARVEIVEGKKHVSDFALWKFSYPNGRSFDSTQDDTSKRRQMEWESPWGLGFPGWHIECSTMSLDGLFHCFTNGIFQKEKVQTIDIHTGGIDHINIHHTNEIAQAESATGKQFVAFWVHHNFLLVNGEKMSKSLGNIYTVQNVIEKGFDPLSLRYLYLQTHYRQEMNFTWESLEAAQIAYQRLVSDITQYTLQTPKDTLLIGCAGFEGRFTEAINEDLNMAKALGILWELVKSDYPVSAKIASLKKFDTVLGLDLLQEAKSKKQKEKIPQEILELVKQREAMRKVKDYKKSDDLREKIRKMGYEIKDTEEGPEVSHRKN